MQGLGRNLAYSLAAQTMVGAGRMVLETGGMVLYYINSWKEGGGVIYSFSNISSLTISPELLQVYTLAS